MVDKVPAIYGALLEVQRGLANIPRNGVMKTNTYSYAYLRADDVQEKLNPLLTENRIVVKADYTVEPVTRCGAELVFVNLTLTYISAEDGSSVSVSAVGESVAEVTIRDLRKPEDKSVNKALTQAIKNAHRATFQFASGEDEPDNHGPQSESPATKAVEAAKTMGKKPAPVSTPAPSAKPAQFPAQVELNKVISDNPGFKTLAAEALRKAVGADTAKTNEHYKSALDAVLSQLSPAVVDSDEAL